MRKGDVFTEENIRSIRPGDGISPKYISEILGKKSKISIKKGTPIKFEFYK